jgi:hypothetical protein
MCPDFSVKLLKEDPANHELWIYEVESNGESVQAFKVTISKTDKVQAKPSPEEKIKEWLKRYPLPKPGTTIRIPSEHFSSF